MSQTGNGMPHGDAPTRRAPNRRRNRRTPGPLYAFSVTLLFVFLAGAMLLPPTGRRYLCEATLSIAESADLTEAELLSQVRQTVLSDETLRQVLVDLGPPRGLPAKMAADWPPYSAIERLHDNVRITPARAAASADRRVTITALASDEQRATALVARLADAVVHDGHGKSDSGPAIDDSLRQQLAKLRQAETETRKTLDRFLQQHFQTVRGELPQSGSKPADVSTRRRPRRPATARPGGVSAASFDGAAGGVPVVLAAFGDAQSPATPNPEYAKLERQLAEKASQRNSLLERLTPLHPEVMQIDLEMQELRQQLYKTPRYLDGSPDGPAATDPTPPGTEAGSGATSPGATSAVDSAALAAQARQYEQLHREYEQARRRLAEAEALVEQHSEAAGSAAALHDPAAKIATAPRITAHSGGAPSGGSLAMLGMLSMVAGALVGLSLRGAREDSRVFTSAEQVGETLGLPVVGDLRTGDSADKARAPARRRQLAAMAVRAAELLLALFALLFLLAAMLDSPFLLETLRNPLGAASQVVRRLTNLF